MQYAANSTSKKVLESSDCILNFMGLSLIYAAKPKFPYPLNFSEIQPPRFNYGDILRWQELDNEADWGIVIGIFYSYARHSRAWEWCYLLWIYATSKSAGWCQFDVAWEDDLELKS